VKKHGGVAMLKVYENEGHGFARVENQIDAYQRVADFLRVRVPSPGCGCGI
jgi:dipeptidyl aminopeptidase/acylaminoacyl peptidase